MSLVLPRRRNRWSQDKEGLWWTSKHRDSTESFEIDFSGPLREISKTETIDSFTATPSGVSVSSSSIVSGVGGSDRAIKLTITESDGYVGLKVTTSSGEILYKELRWVGTPEADPDSDYRYRW